MNGIGARWGDSWFETCGTPYCDGVVAGRCWLCGAEWSDCPCGSNYTWCWCDARAESWRDVGVRHV